MLHSHRAPPTLKPTLAASKTAQNIQLIGKQVSHLLRKIIGTTGMVLETLERSNIDYQENKTEIEAYPTFPKKVPQTLVAY